ncbi:MAG: hypothetical protein HY042_09210, partial [Spirochaetia bacterium]|nr:hypothetical protein [Spirochaetia bacterium]
MNRVENLQVKDKRVLILAGLEIGSTSGIALSIPTIELLLSRGARVIIAGVAGADASAPSFAA